jgi:hypothetical protein
VRRPATRHDHPGCAPRAGQPGVQAAGRPVADDQHLIAAGHAAQLLRVQDAGQRLGQRRFGEPGAVRDPVQPTHGDDLGRDQHELGKAAVMLVAHVLPAGAHRRVASLPLPAGPARDCGDYLNTVPGGPACDLSASADHLTGDLVAKHPWRAEPVVPVPDCLQVGAYTNLLCTR